MATDGLFPSHGLREPHYDPIAPIEFIKQAQWAAKGLGNLSEAEQKSALAAAELDDEFSIENFDSSQELVKPTIKLTGARATLTDPTLATRQEEEARRPDIQEQGRQKLQQANEQRRQRLGGRMPIEQAEAGTRADEGIAAVGDPMTAPEERGQTPEERDAEARWKQTAKFFRTASGGTLLQGGLWAGATAFSPAFGAALDEWKTYKDKNEAGALGRDREEAAKGLVYPALFRDHATAMRNMTTALSGAGAMSAGQVGQIMRAGATSLMESSVKAAQYVASERAKGIKDDKTLGMEAAQTLNNVMKEGVGFVDKFLGDVAVQQGRKDAGEAVEQVAPSLNKIQDPKIRNQAWIAIQAAEERGDKQAILDIMARALSTNPAGATPSVTESVPEQGAAASAPPAGQQPVAPSPALAEHQAKLSEKGRWNTITPDMTIEVDEFESIAPAERANLPTNVLAIPDDKWTASSATPGWFILELTNRATGLVDSYVKSPDGRIWGDDQVEDVVEGML